jgi:hypothetical protein
LVVVAKVWRRKTLGLALIAAALAVSARAEAEPSELPPSFGYNYGETDTPRAAGMSGAMRALGASTTAPYFNPANLGLTRVYHISPFVQITPEALRHLYGGAIIDSTRRFAGGLSLIGGFQDADGIDRSQIDARIPLAFAITDRFLVGLGGRYLMLDQEGYGPLGDSRVSGGLKDPDDLPDGRDALVHTVTFDAGITVRATKEIHIAVAGQNLSYPNHSLLPTMVGGAVGYGGEDFSIEADGVADFNSWEEPSPRFMLGGEYLIADRFPIRAGYRFELLNGSGEDASHQLSAGLGYLDPRFGIEVGVRRTLVGPSATFISFGFSLYLEAFGVPIQDF